MTTEKIKKLQKINLDMAKYLANRYLTNVLYQIKEENLIYPN